MGVEQCGFFRGRTELFGYRRISVLKTENAVIFSVILRACLLAGLFISIPDMKKPRKMRGFFVWNNDDSFYSWTTFSAASPLAPSPTSKRTRDPSVSDLKPCDWIAE